MVYGLLDHGKSTEADVIVNSTTRDIVRRGQFSEIYRASLSNITEKPIAGGVAPSLFGITNLIDNVWLENGVRMEAGLPTVATISSKSAGGVTNLSFKGLKYNASPANSDVDISGPAVKAKALPKYI